MKKIRPYGLEMTEHCAEISWRLGDGNFGLDYDRTHIWRFDGGVEVPASSAPHMRGDPSRVDPEEAFVASISSCHMMWFLHHAAAAGLGVTSYTDRAVGIMRRDQDGTTWIPEVTLHPVIEWIDGSTPQPEVVRALHDDSHRRCFIANSVRTAVTIADL